jgi:organic hydroperoxide reductase OsmC/OhrA
MASRMGRTGAARDAVVRVNVHLGEPEDREGLGLAVDIVVEGADEEVVQAGHAVRPVFRSSQRIYQLFSQLCPYSRALQNGAVVNVSTA